MSTLTRHIRLHRIRFLLVFLSYFVFHSCLDQKDSDMEVNVFFRSGGFFTRSVSPDETKISDANIFVFNCDGLLEQKIYLAGARLSAGPNGFSHSISLLRNSSYSIYVCTNIGFEMKCGNLDELLGYRFYMAYPDDYRIGVPMCGVLKDFTVGSNGAVTVPLTRTMAKISVCIDRSELSPDVEFNVKGIKICNCPKSIVLFQSNRIMSEDESYTAGFSRSGEDISPLNRSISGKTSGRVSLYMFENMQGHPLGSISGNADKVFDAGDSHERQCSYIEMTADYISPQYRSSPGDGLIYRFYLGAGPSDFDVERNCHYHVTVRPVGDGLPDCRWRVDKTGIEPVEDIFLRAEPNGQIQVHAGDNLHARWDYSPADAEIDFDISFWEVDNPEDGLFNYTLDADGKGAVLSFTGSGFCILTIEAGAPIDDIEMLAITVLPQDSG